MFATRSKHRDGQPVHARGTSITQRMARGAALHPWRVVTAWALVLVASVVVIGTLFGSAFSSDASLTTSTDSVKADEVIARSFAQGDPTVRQPLSIVSECPRPSNSRYSVVEDWLSSYMPNTSSVTALGTV